MTSIIDDNIGLQIYIKDKISNISGITYQDKLNTLNQCKCCIRHQTNRPKIIHLWHELPPTYFTDYTHSCQCNCRHIARFLCRYTSTYY